MLDDLQFSVAGGQGPRPTAIALAPGSAPKIELSVDARGLSLQLLDAASGGKRVRGGRTNLVANLALDRADAARASRPARTATCWSR